MSKLRRGVLAAGGLPRETRQAEAVLLSAVRARFQCKKKAARQSQITSLSLPPERRFFALEADLGHLKGEPTHDTSFVPDRPLQNFPFVKTRKNFKILRRLSRNPGSGLLLSRFEELFPPPGCLLPESLPAGLCLSLQPVCR